MNRKEVLKFIQENQNEKLLDFYDKAYQKLKDLNHSIDRLTLYLVLTVFVYFITSGASGSSFQVGPVTISDVSIITMILPVLFAFLFLELVIKSLHKGEVFTVVKLIFLAIYKQEIHHQDLENDRNNMFTRIILPFSFNTELSKFSNQKLSVFSGCLGALLVLPLLSLIVLPFYFEYYMLKEIYHHYYSNALGKISFFLSIWIMLYIIYYLISTMIANYRNRKIEFT